MGFSRINLNNLCEISIFTSCNIIFFNQLNFSTEGFFQIAGSGGQFAGSG
jgi:hypothetical protein